MNNFSIVEDNIPVKVYQYLRVSSGLSPKSNEACETGLKNSIYAVMVKQNDEIIGMGRLVGDGGCFCQVVDICVLPGYQRRGIGKMIMQNLVHFIQNKLPVSCYTSLIADGHASLLYEQFGFKDTLPTSRGMYFCG